MAIFDSDNDSIVVRIAYDGPPMAGKTTSMNALAGILAAKRRSEVFTPGEAEGRTLYFDWMDYRGGLIDGHQVHCQVVSVPGQRALKSRRERLLLDADAVILVADSDADALRSAVDCYESLKPLLARPGEPGVGIVLQANKQDREEAASVEQIREEFSQDAHLAVIGASATSGTGIREAFTFAVRLALDRVRELMKEGQLPVGPPEIANGQELLRMMEAAEADPPNSDVEPRRVQALPGGEAIVEEAPIAEEGAPPPVSVDEGGRPKLPDSNAPGGLVWPPVKGRVLLHELESGKQEIGQREPGGWFGRIDGRWLLYSGPSSEYSGMEAGRAPLLAEARVHAHFSHVLSTPRALVVARADEKAWRLWKIVEAVPSLHAQLSSALASPDIGFVAQALLDAAKDLSEVHGIFEQERIGLSATLLTLGRTDQGVRYVGIVPDAPLRDTLAAETLELESVLRSEFTPHVAFLADKRSSDTPIVLRHLTAVATAEPAISRTVEVISAMLIGH
jgi:signal recognition particle receptor subunit beta